METQRWKSLVTEHPACRSWLKTGSRLLVKGVFYGTTWKSLTWLGRVSMLNTENIVSLGYKENYKWKNKDKLKGKDWVNCLNCLSYMNSFLQEDLPSVKPTWITEAFKPPLGSGPFSPYFSPWGVEWNEQVESKYSYFGHYEFPELENDHGFPFHDLATTSPRLYPESLSLADRGAGPESLRALLHGVVLWPSYHLRKIKVVGEAEGLPCLCLGGSEQRKGAPAVTWSTYLHGYTPSGGCLPTITHWWLRERRKHWPVSTEPCTWCVRPELENEQMFALH